SPDPLPCASSGQREAISTCPRSTSVIWPARILTAHRGHALSLSAWRCGLPTAPRAVGLLGRASGGPGLAHLLGRQALELKGLVGAGLRAVGGDVADGMLLHDERVVERYPIIGCGRTDGLARERCHLVGEDGCDRLPPDDERLGTDEVFHHVNRFARS